MNKNAISSIRALDREISRLEEEARAKEKELGEEIRWLKHNSGRLFTRQFFCNRHEEKATGETGCTLTKWLTSHLATRVTDYFEEWFHKLFTRKARHKK